MAKTRVHSIYVFDRFRLDRDRLMLYRDETEISLPPKVIKTLAILIENRGTIISKDELIEMVWPDSIVEESNLSQYLYLLRKTLGNQGDGRPYIETLRRRGYRFNGEVIELDAEHEAASGGGSTENGTDTQSYPSATTSDATNESVSALAEPQRPTLGAEFRERRLNLKAALALMLLAALGVGYWYVGSPSTAAQIQSVAVLPFQNASGNPDLEYLSDGMTETLINSLSQMPHLSVKARSSVFRYKNKEVEPQSVAAELSVQAILQGRVMQRGDDLTLYLSLVDGRTGDQLWGEQYERKMTDLLALQGEIARDISRKLRARLAGADEQRIA